MQPGGLNLKMTALQRVYKEDLNRGIRSTPRTPLFLTRQGQGSDNPERICALVGARRKSPLRPKSQVHTIEGPAELFCPNVTHASRRQQ